jgi:mono/diheme cytochrome c family protein
MIGPRLRFTVFIATAGIFGPAVGCTPTPPPAAPAPKGGMPTPMVEAAVEPGPFLEGRKVLQAHNCIRCHTIGDAPPGKGMMKKNLTTVGTDHPREWIVAHVRDAKTHNPKSRMPPYDTTKISDTDMDALADYLTSLK